VKGAPLIDHLQASAFEQAVTFVERESVRDHVTGYDSDRFPAREVVDRDIC